MAGETYQILDITTTNRIIQTLIYRIASHPWICAPLIQDASGQPVRINKFRNFDGKALNNPRGITLSVFPYHYGNDASKEPHNITVGSKNASARWALTEEKPTLGANGQDTTTYNVVMLSISLKLDIFGWSQVTQQNNQIIDDQETTFEFNYREWLLRQYADIIALVLTDNKVRRLPSIGPVGQRRFLLEDSWVDTVNFPTASWTAGPNSILHSASIIWQAKYYMPREWRLPTDYSPYPMTDGLLYLGEFTLSGTPTQAYYDTVGMAFVDANSNPLQRTDLNDPAGVLWPSLDADLVKLIDSAPQGIFDFSFFMKKVDNDWTC